MSFYDECLKYKDFDFKGFFDNLSDQDIIRAMEKEKPNIMDFLTLISEKAEKYIENIAQKAHDITIRNFGKTIVLFTPMYVSDFCSNQCVYCGFNRDNRFKRKQLTYEEVETEAKIIAGKGLKNILLLTGDAPHKATVEYINNCILILKKYFSSIGIEIYALQTEEYKQLIDSGVDLFCMFQETYNEEIYKKMHLSGPKKDYRFRLDAPERVCKAGIRTVSIGGLFGLDELWRREAFFIALHAQYLQNKYSGVEVGISIPRMRPHLGSFMPSCEVTDKNFVQYMTAFRMFMPKSGITISTRENAKFRDNIINLGVTKMSADSNTAVGGHTNNDTTAQFDISDGRDVKEMRESITKLGYQPIMKNWEII